MLAHWLVLCQLAKAISWSKHPRSAGFFLLWKLWATCMVAFVWPRYGAHQRWIRIPHANKAQYMHLIHTGHHWRTYTGHIHATAIHKHTILDPVDAAHMARASVCMTKIRYISTLKPRPTCRKWSPYANHAYWHTLGHLYMAHSCSHHPAAHCFCFFFVIRECVAVHIWSRYGTYPCWIFVPRAKKAQNTRPILTVWGCTSLTV